MKISVNSHVSEHHYATDHLSNERQRDERSRGIKGAQDERPSLMPANHREQRAPIVRGAITRVDKKRELEVREREREGERQRERAVTRRGRGGASNK